MSSIIPHLQRLNERCLRDVNLADLAHALFALFLLVVQLALADVAAVELAPCAGAKSSPAESLYAACVNASVGSCDFAWSSSIPTIRPSAS